MRKGTLRATLTTALLAAGAVCVQAQTPIPLGNTLEIRVINHHTSAVRVYVEDRFGTQKLLGWVNHSDTRTLTVPTDMTKLGSVDIKIFADQPVMSLRSAPYGVQTRPLNLRAGDVVSLRLQTRLEDSYIQISRS